jgi:hypothetical protein
METFRYTREILNLVYLISKRNLHIVTYLLKPEESAVVRERLCKLTRY